MRTNTGRMVTPWRHCSDDGAGGANQQAGIYAITGRIPKLEALPASEMGASYYCNRVHSGGVRTIALTLLPAVAGQPVTVTVQRDSADVRTVSATGGADANAILAELNREFVLLDGRTFQASST